MNTGRESRGGLLSVTFLGRARKVTSYRAAPGLSRDGVTVGNAVNVVNIVNVVNVVTMPTARDGRDDAFARDGRDGVTA